MITLTEKAVLAIRNSTKLKGQLQATLNISGNTLYAWLKRNDPKLTIASALQNIKDETGMCDEEMLQIV